MADQGIELTNTGSQSGRGQRPPVGRPDEAYEWPELKYSSYAISLSYLMMSMRGLNILIFTWSTVVLLGGFVSMLQKKDFWCLTIVTLLQVPGLFNPNFRDKVVWLQHLPKGFGAIIPTSGLEASRARHIVGRAARAAAVLVALVGGICLMLVVGFGVPIATGLSLWRLMQRDYGVAKNDDGSKANLTPGLDVLYSLVVLQSAFFLLCSVFDVAGLRLAEAVVKEYQVGGNSEGQLFEAYFAEIKVGCYKDLSFADGKNLVTYAVGLMCSDEPTRYVAGVRILGSLFGPQWPLADRSSLDRRASILMQRWAIAAHMLTRSPSSGHVVQSLLRTVGPTYPYGREAREAAARVVRLISHDIYLEQLPGGIQCIASLLDISDEHRNLMLYGLTILDQLAAAESNCRVMSDTPDLISMVVAPAISFHADHDAVRKEVALVSLAVVDKLISAPGETGVKLRQQIVTDDQAVSAVESILACDQCHADLQEKAMTILKLLHICKPSAEASDQTRAKFVRFLVSIFAGDKMHEVTVRNKAVHTLRHICTAHSSDVEFPLKKEIINGIRKVLSEQIYCESSGGTEANDRGFSEPSTTDIENFLQLRQYLASLLNMSDENGDQNGDLVFQGLNILNELATDERNCIVMSDTPDLISMVVAPASSFHADHDAVRQKVALVSLAVVGSLIYAPGETGDKLRRQIVTDEQAVSAMESILECDQCGADLQERAIMFLECLYFCRPSGEASNQRRAKFIRILVSIFAGDKKHEAAVRRKAAHTLGHICNSHSGDVEYPLKEEIINGIRKVLSELICCESRGGGEANDRGFSEPSTRDLEANVVRLISHEINLEQFPRGLRCNAPLLDLSEEQGDLVFHGLNILRMLASDELNCRVMSDSPDLLSMFVAPASFHADHDAVRQKVVLVSLLVVGSLIHAPGDTGDKLRRQIVTDEQAVSAMESILECDQCGADLQERAIMFLEWLYFCRPSGEASNQRRAKFIRILVSIFAGDRKNEAAVRIKAAHTLGHICAAHSGGVEYPLKEEISNGIGKVLTELICCESSGGAEVIDRGFSERSTTDLEANVARLISHDINLEQFPRRIRCIAPLLDISGEQRDLVFFHGLNILRMLASGELNCRVMRDSPDLLSLFVAPASFHADHDAVRQEVTLKWLDVVGRLLNSPGESGDKLQHQIETDEQVVSAVESILECDQCRADLQGRAMEILELLHFSKVSGESSETRAKFIMILVSILAGDRKQTTGVRIKAASTLLHIWTIHSSDVEDPLKEEIINAIPKVQNELNCCGSSGGAEANDQGFSERSTDLEAQLPSQEDGCNDTSPFFNQQNSEHHLVDELKAVLVDLYEMVSKKLVSGRTYLPPQDDGAASESVAKPHGRRSSRGKQKKYGKGGKHGKWSRMMMASPEEEQEPLLC